MFRSIIFCVGISVFCPMKPMQSSVFTGSDVDTITAAIKKMPEHNQPKDLAQSISFMKQGAKVWDLIKKYKLGSAILLNFSSRSNQEFGVADRISKAYDTTDLQFWNVIKNDKNLKEKATRNDIPFTYEALQKVDYNMYYRSTYLRINSQDEKVQSYFNNFIKAYQTTIVQLQWYLYAQAILQDSKAFNSGMISLEDPNHLLFKTLDGYAELVSPKYKLHSGISLHSLVTTKAYTRESSHYEGQKYFKNDFGIDIQDDDNQPLRILPGNKSHLLYGIRSNGMTFIKWEDYGVTFNPIKGDTSVVPHLKGFLDKRDVQDDPELNRREKTPTDVTQEFEQLYGKSLSKQDQKNIKIEGISYMLQLLDKSKSAKFTNYLVTNKGYHANTLDARKGGEVILNL